MSRNVGYLLLFLLCFWAPSEAWDSYGGEKNILIITSNNPSIQRTSDVIFDYEAEYKRKGGKSNIIIESLNCKSFSESVLWTSQLKKILLKYQEEKTPSHIILLGQEAWNTYYSLRDSIEHKVPVMCGLTSSHFMSLPTDTLHALKEWLPESMDILDSGRDIPELLSGFVHKYNIEDNIRMIQTFYPHTKHIALITDNTCRGVAMQALIRKKMKKYPQLDLILLDGRAHSLNTIVDNIRNLPPNTIVLVGIWHVDKDESYYYIKNATYSIMEAMSHIPTFTPSSEGIGDWAIGGVYPDYRAIGKEMAWESLRIENSTVDRSRNITVIKSKAVLDSEKMKKWHLDPQVLPFEVEIVNKPLTLYEQYTYQIWSVSILIVMLSFGLCFSIFFYFRTKRLKNALQKSSIELVEAKDKAEESNRLKSAFLANISHEIRTPLNSIVGFSELLVEMEGTEEERKAFYPIIKTNSDLLLRLIDDILDLSRLETERVDLIWTLDDVVPFCERVLDMIRLVRPSDNQLLFFSTVSSCRMQIDEQRLQQVLINLLNNAIKLTKEGVITLSFTIDEEKQLALFTVTDTGCGIPKDKHKMVFERFEKLNKYVQGTGLGLAICKMIVNKWGGEIWIDSDYTDGARFVFSHPLTINEV